MRCETKLDSVRLLRPLARHFALGVSGKARLGFLLLRPRLLQRCVSRALLVCLPLLACRMWIWLVFAVAQPLLCRAVLPSAIAPILPARPLDSRLLLHLLHPVPPPFPFCASSLPLSVDLAGACHPCFRLHHEGPLPRGGCHCRGWGAAAAAAAAPRPLFARQAVVGTRSGSSLGSSRGQARPAVRLVPHTEAQGHGHFNTGVPGAPLIRCTHGSTSPRARAAARLRAGSRRARPAQPPAAGPGTPLPPGIGRRVSAESSAVRRFRCLHTLRAPFSPPSPVTKLYG